GQFRFLFGLEPVRSEVFGIGFRQIELLPTDFRAIKRTHSDDSFGRRREFHALRLRVKAQFVADPRKLHENAEAMSDGAALGQEILREGRGAQLLGVGRGELGGVLLRFLPLAVALDLLRILLLAAFQGFEVVLQVVEEAHNSSMACRYCDFWRYNSIN